MRLTKATVPKLAIPDGKTELLVFDDAIPGFGLRMRAGGKRTWIAQYRIGRKQRRITLGSTATLDADEARKHAKAVLSKVTLGEDPQGQKDESRSLASLTFGAVVPRFLSYAEARASARHHAATRTYLEKHFGAFSGLGLRSINRGVVSERLLDIKAKRGPFAANRARAALSAFFSWSIGEGLCDINPVTGTHKPTAEVKRDRVLTDEELALVWNCAASGEFGNIVRLLILTAARREEIGGMRWPELNGDLIQIGADRSKNGQPLEIPLSAPAAAIVATLPRREGRDLVFGSGTGPFQGWSKAKAELDGRMKASLKTGHGASPQFETWRLHDLRRTAATRMADIGVLPHVIEAVLGHISGSKAGVAGIYNRASYLPEKRAALALWGEHVAKIVGVTA